MSKPRNIRVAPEVMDAWWTRDYDGNRLRVEWGEPGPDGLYEPTITVDYSDNICARLRRIEEAAWAALDAWRGDSEWTLERESEAMDALRAALEDR